MPCMESTKHMISTGNTGKIVRSSPPLLVSKWSLTITWSEHSGVGDRGASALQKFWFGENPRKIPETPGKIQGNLGEFCENLRKNPENLGRTPRKFERKWRPMSFGLKTMAPNVVWFEEMAPNTVFIRIYSHKWPKIFSGKFGEIWAKTFAPPKLCLLLHLWVNNY